MCYRRSATARTLALIAFAAVIGTACGTSSSVKKAENTNGWKLKQSPRSDNNGLICALSSPPKRYATGAGVDEERILVHADGTVSLRTVLDAFDTRAIRQIGISVDDRPAFLAPTPVGSHELRFTAQDSEALLEQMTAGRTARIQVALHPRKELLTGVYSLRGFEQALLNYRMCEVMDAERQALLQD